MIIASKITREPLSLFKGLTVIEFWRSLDLTSQRSVTHDRNYQLHVHISDRYYQYSRDVPTYTSALERSLPFITSHRKVLENQISWYIGNGQNVRIWGGAFSLVTDNIDDTEKERGVAEFIQDVSWNLSSLRGF